MNVVQKLRQLVSEIRAAQKPLQVQKDWELVGRLLGRFPEVDQAKAAEAVSRQNIDALDAIVFRLEHPSAPAPAPAAEEIDPELMRAAMKAYRKRLKLMRLNDESKLTRRLSSGRTSEIDAIIPPTEYRRAVWEALVRAGELESVGEGFYALAKGKGKAGE